MPKHIRSTSPRLPHLLRGGHGREIADLRRDLIDFCSHCVTNDRTLDLYVDSVRGRDTNEGTQTRPIRTLDEAFDRIPILVQFPVRIHLASGTHVWNKPLGPRLLAARIYIIGDGAGTGDGFNVLATGTVQSGSTQALLETVGGLTVDQYHGKTLEITSGLCAGDRRSISTNTTSGLVPAATFRALPAPGDTYRILEPSVVLVRHPVTFPATAAPFATPAVQGIGNQGSKPHQRTNGSAGNDVYLVNVRLTGSGPTMVIWDFQNCSVAMFGVELDRPSNLFLATEADGRSLIQAGMDYRVDRHVRVIGPFADGLVDHTEKWRGWGLTQPFATTNSSGLSFSNFVGYCCLQRVTIDGDWWVFGGSFVSATNGFSTVVVRDARHVTVGDWLPNGSQLPVVIKNKSSTDIKAACVKSHDGAVVNLVHATLEKTNRGFGAVACAMGDHESVAPGTISIAGDVGLVQINAVAATNTPDHALVAAGGGRLNWHDRYLEVSGWAGDEAAVWAGRIDTTSPEVSQDLTAFTTDGAFITSTDGSVIQRY